MTGKVTGELFGFPTAPRILGAHPYIFLPWTLNKTDISRNGQCQVTFLEPYPVTVTDTRLTSRKYVVNIFLKDITTGSGQDSNRGPSAPVLDS